MKFQFNNVKDVKNPIHRRTTVLLIVIVLLMTLASLSARGCYEKKSLEDTDAAYIGTSIFLPASFTNRVTYPHPAPHLVYAGEGLLASDDTNEKLNYTKAASFLVDRVKTMKHLFMADGEYNASLEEVQIVWQQAQADYQPLPIATMGCSRDKAWNDADLKEAHKPECLFEIFSIK